MFVYFHFNVPPTEITDLITEMYQMKRFIDIERSPLSMFLLLLNWFVYSQLYSIANECSICHFCIMIKDLSIYILRVITIQDFKTVTFNLLLVYKPTFLVVFY